MAEGPPPPIRDATPEDAAGIARVHVATWRTTYRGLLPDAVLDGLDEGSRAAWWARLLRGGSAPGGVVVVAEADGEIVGFASGGEPISPVIGFDAGLWALYVLEPWQGKGLGRRLMTAIADRLAGAGRRSLVLWVLDGNPAQKFYEALGGREVGRKVETFGDAPVEEVGYGWDDIGTLLPENRPSAST